MINKPEFFQFKIKPIEKEDFDGTEICFEDQETHKIRKSNLIEFKKRKFTPQKKLSPI